MAREFVHLHLHSQYSILDGAIRFEELFELLERYGMKACALTDHGNMFGAIEFYTMARQRGIKPILGCEVYVAPNSRRERSGEPHHLVLLAMDREGYRNLCHLVSLGYLEGFYQKPRIDLELLEELNRGLLVLTSCLKGEIPSLILKGDWEGAKRKASYFKEVFGDRFYLELQDNGIEEQKRVNEGLLKLARELDIKVLATNDCHYLRREDAFLHDVLLCIQTGKTLNDPRRLRFQTDQFHLRSPEEMEALFGHVPQALSNTLEVAERCQLELDLGHYQLPHFDPPEGKTLEGYLEELAEEGLRRRIQERGIRDPGPYWERLKRELQVINSMGFAGYFLIVQDFVNWAKERGIAVGPGRGSAAGSLVAYCLGITDIDPLEHGLLFERFLNPERVSLPDIDVDFCYERRDEVIQYVKERYGHDKVAHIITFGKMQARAVVRDVGRVLGIPYREVDIIAKLIPGGPNVTLQEALALEPRLRELAQRDDSYRKLLEIALRLEGMVRHASTHAAGVVIANRPLMDYMPLYRGKEGEITTQYAMKEVEQIGLVKFDLLGLKTLTMIEEILRLLKERRGIEIDLRKIPLDDPETYRLLSEGDTTGVFQLESQGMRDLLRKIKPQRFSDLVALLALYRPGPLGSGMVEDYIKRRRDKQKIQYLHDSLRDILEETYGVLVYQEQVMMVASALADFSLGEADLLRKAMSKKVPEEMARLRDRFIEGASRKGIDRQKASEIFDSMAKFAEYGFNKSHSAAYALIAYRTAYLKAHYPHEFMAALLTSDMNDSDKVMRYVSECKDRGIEVLKPDINSSLWEFTVEGDSPPKIRFGLGAIKNVGEAAVRAILEAREAGPFKNFTNFCLRVDPRKVNRRAIESLIKAGAFDEFGSRSRLLDLLPKVIQKASKGRNSQATLFRSLPEEEPPLREWTESEVLRAEKEVLGFYLSGHPLKDYEHLIREKARHTIRALEDLDPGQGVRIAGLVVNLREIRTKKGDRMATAEFEDLTGRIEGVVFPDLFRESRPLLLSEEPLLISGILEKDDDGRPRLRVQSLKSLLEAEGSEGLKRVRIKIKAEGLDRGQLEALKELFRRNQGPCETFLHLISPKKEVVIRLPEDFRLNPTEDLNRQMESLLGPTAFVVEVE
ncbi:MAG: DNA polymerase III subunit alpha [Deltaproteobacteria bacterium]|nr:MAG: DNA polymerase III subunit alpha [Deltaproteobacteria bacterium]